MTLTEIQRFLNRLAATFEQGVPRTAVMAQYWHEALTPMEAPLVEEALRHYCWQSNTGWAPRLGEFADLYDQARQAQSQTRPVQASGDLATVLRDVARQAVHHGPARARIAAVWAHMPLSIMGAAHAAAKAAYFRQVAAQTDVGQAILLAYANAFEQASQGQVLDWAGLHRQMDALWVAEVSCQNTLEIP
jgi:hypothetical protein